MNQTTDSRTTTFAESVFGNGILGRRIVPFFVTWIVRFGSVTVGLVLIFGSVLYFKQDSLLVRLFLKKLLSQRCS